MNELKSMSVEVKIRRGVPEDEAFIYSSWIKSAAGTGHPPADLADALRSVIDGELLQNSVAVACDPNDESQVYGYLVWDHPVGSVLVLRWCYVKQAFRRLGVATALVNAVDGRAAGEAGALSRTPPRWSSDALERVLSRLNAVVLKAGTKAARNQNVTETAETPANVRSGIGPKDRSMKEESK